MTLKAVILAGGFGTRLSEETEVKPKPMVEIGGKPILWHIMKIYSHYGIKDFVICLGYKGYLIKEYFANYFLHQSNMTIDLEKNKIKVHNNNSEPWTVTLIDTGDGAMTGARIKKIKDYVDDTFLLTYGDAVSDININSLLEFHKSHKGGITMTVVHPDVRFGTADIGEKNRITGFREKHKDDHDRWVNGGFFVCNKKIFDYIPNGNNITFEKEPLENMAKDGQLYAYQHKGFWKCMDTLRDKTQLE
ncbi:MAG: glucose-1-phosphate cytidylyltransferase [Candidatus Aenigmarchaeota archaeon]|nr:glucose-1-phosphate cytidylyltransferase [Candidatus Aenigmarchaeota archaeon]